MHDSVFIGSPSLAFKPSHLAAYCLGGHDILFIGVADHEHLLRLHAQGIDTKLKYLRVGLPYSYHGTLDNLAEIMEQTEIGKHAFHIAIEIAHEHHRIHCSKTVKHRLCLFHTPARRIVAILGDVRGINLHLTGRNLAIVGKPLQFYDHLLVKQIVKIIVGQDMGMLRQLALGIYIRLAEGVFIHLHPYRPVAIPDDLTPVGATAVNCTAVIKYDSFNAFNRVHLSIVV